MTLSKKIKCMTLLTAKLPLHNDFNSTIFFYKKIINITHKMSKIIIFYDEVCGLCDRFIKLSLKLVKTRPLEIRSL